MMAIDNPSLMSKKLAYFIIKICKAYWKDCVRLQRSPPLHISDGGLTTNFEIELMCIILSSERTAIKILPSRFVPMPHGQQSYASTDHV